MELALFVVLAVIAVITAAGVVLSKKAATSALFLLLNFCTLAGLYILLNAQFIAVAQVIVYAGAIVVLFLFVVMLLSPGKEEGQDQRPYAKIFAVFLAVLMLVEVGYVVFTGVLGGTPGQYTPERIDQVGNVQAIGQVLFTDFLLPFELASVLLLVGIVGAVVLAKREL
jgi:NADH-quinone oxidoreductase subunit J